MFPISVLIIVFQSCLLCIKGQWCYVCEPCARAEAEFQTQSRCAGGYPTYCVTTHSIFASAGALDLKKGKEYEVSRRECVGQFNVTTATMPCIEPSEIYHVGGKACIKKTLKSYKEYAAYNLCLVRNGISADQDGFAAAKITFFSFTDCFCEGDGCNNENVNDPSVFPVPDRVGSLANVVASQLPPLCMLLVQFAMCLVACISRGIV